MTFTVEMKHDPLNIIRETIDMYYVFEYLTTGGTAHIYIARGKGKTVVIKLLRDELSNEPDAKRRFHKEAFALRQVEHPHIIKLLDDGRYQHNPYLVFEYAALGNLQDYATVHGHELTLGDVAIIVVQIAGALHALHQNNFIHRDVKPSNILMRSAEDAALADFGIVRNDDVNTRFRVQPGTLDFMAPEQIEGLDADFTTDQYALAILSYWLLTGKKPFEANSREEAALQRRVGAASVHDIDPKLPEAFDAVLSRAMHVDMNERYTFIEEFAHNLAQIIEDDHLQSLPALGTSIPRTNISRDVGNKIDSAYPTKKSNLFKSLMEPYGWISIGILCAMLLILLIYISSPFGGKVQATPSTADSIISELLDVTRNPASFDCTGFVPLYTELSQVAEDSAEFVVLLNENSATRTIYTSYCITISTGQAASIDPLVWQAMRAELESIPDN